MVQQAAAPNVKVMLRPRSCGLNVPASSALRAISIPPPQFSAPPNSPSSKTSPISARLAAPTIPRLQVKQPLCTFTCVNTFY